MSEDETTNATDAGDPQAEAGGQLDLSEIRVESLMLQVASELMSIGAGQLGMIPEMVNGGDAFQASLAIAGADALLATFLSALPEGTPVPQPVDDLRRALAELQLAFANAIEAAGAAADAPDAAAADKAPSAPTPPREEPPRPKIWTPGGDV